MADWVVKKPNKSIVARITADGLSLGPSDETTRTAVFYQHAETVAVVALDAGWMVIQANNDADVQ